MGPLFLLASSLLSGYFQSGSAADTQPFTISSVTLSIEPQADVPRNTNVTVRCKAKVLVSGSEALTRTYEVYKDNEIIHSKTTSSSEDFLYPLFNARVSNNGKYKCQIIIGTQKMASETEKLTVTGLSRPVLRLTQSSVAEGEEITLSCAAPDETGSILVYFYDDSKEIHDMQMTSRPAEAKIRLKGAGSHKLRCSYTVLLMPDSVKSEESNAVTVTVRELSISPVLEISPKDNIYEGDPLNITCTVRNLLHSYGGIALILSEGTRMLGLGNSSISHNMISPASASSLTFECTLMVQSVKKLDTKTVPVAELFSMPTLTMSPPQVFQKDLMTLTCSSERVATERLDHSEITYALHPPENTLFPNGTGEFSGKALLNDFNYTCVARARNIEKSSRILTVRPKVPVSTPEISVRRGRVILGEQFQIHCRSSIGSLPITYRLHKDYKPLGQITVKDPNDEALFDAKINNTDEIKKYFCEAINKGGKGPLSKSLNASVIVSTSHPILSVVPDLEGLSEGSNLHLLCNVNGTPPITFRWYRVGDQRPLKTTTSMNNFESHDVPVLTKADSGKYYCEAVNLANNWVTSESVTIEVRTAMWKKALIGGAIFLVVSVLVLVFAMYFKSKRVRVTGTAVSVWSERKPDADKDEEKSSLSNELDVEYTEVVHPRSADPARVPLKKGTDTVYSELQNSSHGAADHHDYGSIEYAGLNGEQPEAGQFQPEVLNYPDLPVPVD